MTWIILAFIAALFKSFGTIFEKQVLTSKSPSDYISGANLVIALCSLPLLFFVQNNALDSLTFFYIYVCSILAAISAISITYIIQKLDISESTAIFATTPIIVAFMGSIFIGEFLTWIQLLGIFISSLGLFILEYGNTRRAAVDLSKHPRHHKRKIYFMLTIGLITFGLTTIGDRFIIHYRDTDPLLYLVIIQLCICINTLIYSTVKQRSSETPILNPKLLVQKSFWANMLCIIGHRITHMFAINLVAAGILNTVKQVSAVITTVVGGKVFKEKELIRKTLACIIILAGTAIVLL